MFFEHGDTKRICLLQYVEDTELASLLHALSVPASSESLAVRHGTILALSSVFRHGASHVCASSAFPTVIDCLKSRLNDDKV